MSPCPGAGTPRPAASDGRMTCQLVLRVSTFVPSLAESITVQLKNKLAGYTKLWHIYAVDLDPAGVLLEYKVQITRIIAINLE